MSSHEALGRVILVTGAEEFLAERAVSAARASVRAADAEAEFSETTGDQMSGASLGDLSAASLFTAVRCVLIRQVENIPDDAHADVLGYAAEPSPDVCLVLVHSGVA